MNRYKEKSKFDEERFLKEDEGYLLKESRPIKPNAIRRLNKAKMFQFIEDVLTNKKLTSVLYASNAKIEIKTYLKTKKNFEHKKDEIEKKRKEKNEPSSVVKKRSRKEAYMQMREEIDKYKYNKFKYKRALTQNNNKKIKIIKEEIEKEKKEYLNDIKSNFIDGFKRGFSRLKFKLDILKAPSNEKFMETEVDYPFVFEFTSRKINFPKTKLKIKNVFSRLYNNAVILPKDDKKLRKRPFSALNRKNSNTMNKKKETKFKLKNALTSNMGKEFTIRITDSNLERYLTSRNEENDDNTGKSPYLVNYYNLIDPKTGNSFLHIAAMENYPELVKYFIEKGANLNMKNNDGNTPLHLALKRKNKKIIKLLMDNKAALDIPNSEGDIPFEYFTSEMKKEYGVDKILVINPVKKK
jgi:hypothetical protein